MTTNKIDLYECVNDALKHYENEFSQEEFINIKKMIINLVGKDSYLQKQIRSKEGKKCIAYLINEHLCKGSGKEIELPQYSHVIPDNQMQKFREKHEKIYKTSNLLFDFFTDKVIETSSKAPIFVGFCSSCEKLFTEDNPINIDTETNFTKKHMFKSLYRYLGKEITGYTELIKFLKTINNSHIVDPIKEIRKEDLNLFFERTQNSSLNLVINKYIQHHNYLKSLYLELNNYLLNEYYASPHDVSNAYELFCAHICADKLPLVGQSVVHIPLLFKDLETKNSIFINFIYDKEKNLTKCYMLILKNIYETLFKNHPSFFENDINKSKLMVLFSFLNTSELYFSEDFKDKSRPHILKLINSAPKNASLAEEINALIVAINNGDYDFI